MSNRPKYQQKPIESQANQQNNNQTQNNAGQTKFERRRYQNYNDNRNYKKNKYQLKEKVFTSKYGFEYDQNKIKYNTEIPLMPEKLKSKPDENKYNQKVQEIENQVNQLKKIRKQKKQAYKHGNQDYRKQIQQQKHNIKLAQACLVILNFDKDDIDARVSEIQNKITFHRKKIDQLNKPTEKMSKKKIQEMNYQELLRQEERILNQMSTQDLKKSEEVQLNSRLNKIYKRKVQVPKQSQNGKLTHDDHQKLEEIQTHREAIERLRKARQAMSDRLTDISQKIQSITDNIFDFEENIQKILQKQKNTDNSTLLEEAAELKQRIYTLWDELAEIKQQYSKKFNQYEEEQEKIKYIKWAEQIKQKMKEEWQLQKQQRKKQRLREKGKKPEEGKEGQQKTSDKKPEYERKKINKNQKEIDTCSFLIQYCKDLTSASNQNNTNQDNARKQINIQEALKKGQWAKMKNVEIIQSKKKKGQEQAQPKHTKKRQVKSPVVQTSDRFSHVYFIAQTFDSVKVLPPSKPEELQKTITELEDKLQYFLAHPDQQTSKSSRLIETRDEKQRPAKGSKKIINTEQFPALR